MGEVGVVSRKDDNDELAPRPLHILKHIHPATSIENGANTDRCSSASLTRALSQRALVPTRKSSIIGSTWPCPPQQRPVEASSSLARGDTLLNVRKQRQNHRSITIAAPNMTPTPSDELMANSKPENPTLRIKPAAAVNRYTWQTWPTMSRSLSTNIINSREFLKPSKQTPSILSDSARITESRRRATVASESAPIDLCTPTGSQILQRQQSSRRSLVSQVMTGLSTKSQVSNIKPIDSDQFTFTPPLGKEDDRKHNQDMTRRSQSSTRRVPRTEEDLSKALAVFPTPPETAITPSTSMKASSEESRPRPLEYRDLCAPQTVAPLTAELSLTTEFDHISFEKCESMFVAIDVKATVPGTTAVRHREEPATALDTVIIIDNSLHTSPASLMASCETTRFLASILNPETDRIAIVRTSIANNSTSDSNIIAPLSHIRMRIIKSLLDEIMIPSPGSHICNAADSLCLAQRLLLESCKDEKSTGNTSLLNYGHVFLFTTHVDESFPHFVLDDRISLHVICASVLPQKDEHWPPTNGWKLRSLTGKEPRIESRMRKEDDLPDMAQDLKTLIQHARSGQRLGLLNEVGLDLTAGPDMIIEEVLGSKEIASLQPGEVHSVTVKVRCKTPKTTEAWLSGGLPAAGDDDLFGELERMLLGFTATPVLHAALSYNHPLLPSDVTCCVVKTCNVRRFISAPGDPDIIRKPASILESAERVTVHQRLAFHYFTQLKPQAAMSALQKIIGAGDGRMACPEYVALLMKEQQFQARIVTRMSDFNTPTKPGKLPHEAENQSPDHFPTNGHERQGDGTDKLPSSPHVSPNPKRRSSLIFNNRSVMAKRIWGDVRKKWNAFETGDTMRNVSSKDGDEQAKEIEKPALKNKKSIASQTLRSLSTSAKASTGSAPRWA